MKTLVLIPARNEQESLAPLIKRIKKTIKCTILVIDDASTDNTKAIAKKAGAKVVSMRRHSGLAKVFKRGLKEAVKLKPDIIVHIDADGQYLPKEIPKLIKPIKDKEADLVMGSRFMGKIEEMPITKYYGNIAFSLLTSIIVGSKITDSQTGFRAFTLNVAKNMKIISDHTYVQEMIIRAVRKDFEIKEVPVFFAKRRSGPSRLITHPFEYAFRAIFNLIKVYFDC